MIATAAGATESRTQTNGASVDTTSVSRLRWWIAKIEVPSWPSLRSNANVPLAHVTVAWRAPSSTTS